MVLQKQYNLRRWNNATTECISLIQSAGFLNQTIYKPEHAVETPTTTALFFAIAVLVAAAAHKTKCPALFSGTSLSAAVTV